MLQQRELRGLSIRMCWLCRCAVAALSLRCRCAVAALSLRCRCAVAALSLRCRMFSLCVFWRSSVRSRSVFFNQDTFFGAAFQGGRVNITTAKWQCAGPASC